MNRNIKKNSDYVQNEIEVRLKMIREWIYGKKMKLEQGLWNFYV